MQETYHTGKTIVKFFFKPFELFSDVEKKNSRLELLRVGQLTRFFASNYIMLDRLINCREALASCHHCSHQAMERLDERLQQ